MTRVLVVDLVVIVSAYGGWWGVGDSKSKVSASNDVCIMRSVMRNVTILKVFRSISVSNTTTTTELCDKQIVNLV